ncbi:MAG: MFS transporter [Pseudomonadota bacterium]
MKSNVTGGELERGWMPLLAATIGTMCGIFTLTNYSQGFFVGPVTSEFGWTPPQFFLSYTVLMCFGLITGPVVGSLVGRYGLRTVGIIGLAGHSFAYVLLSFNTGSLLVWYLSFAALAVLGAGSLPIVWTSVLNGWFHQHRGKAIGITMAGTGLGAFLLPPVVEILISNYGWRTAYRGLGLGAAIISLPIVFALFREKTDDAAAGPSGSPVGWGLTRNEAMRTGRFWILGAVLFLTVLVLAGLLSNFPRIMTEQGLARPTIAKIAAIMGLTVILGRLLVGALVDRFWAPAVAASIFLLPIAALLMIVNFGVTPTSGILIGILIGLAAGAELDLLAFLTSKFFGPANYSAIFGVIIAFFTVGAGIAPPLFGAAAQYFQGYTMVLWGAIGLLALSVVLFLAMGQYPEPTEKNV